MLRSEKCELIPAVIAIMPATVKNTIDTIGNATAKAPATKNSKATMKPIPAAAEVALSLPKLPLSAAAHD